MQKQKKRKKVIRSIRLAYSSLKSHLDSAVSRPKKSKLVGSRKFHATCVKEYAEIIKTLAAHL